MWLSDPRNKEERLEASGVHVQNACITSPLAAERRGGPRLGVHGRGREALRGLPTGGKGRKAALQIRLPGTRFRHGKQRGDQRLDASEPE